MHAPEIRLIVPDTPALIEATRAIFREYAASLEVDLSFQDFDQELQDLPGEYAGPNGCLLLALVDDAVAGCATCRPRPKRRNARRT